MPSLTLPMPSSACSHTSCLSPCLPVLLMGFVALIWMLPCNLVYFYIVWPRTAHSSQGEATPVLNMAENHFFWPPGCAFLVQPRCTLLAHTEPAVTDSPGFLPAGLLSCLCLHPT